MPENGIRSDWDMRLYNPENVPNQVKDLIHRTRAMYDKVADVPDAEVNFENTIKASEIVSSVAS